LVGDDLVECCFVVLIVGVMMNVMSFLGVNCSLFLKLLLMFGVIMWILFLGILVISVRKMCMKCGIWVVVYIVICLFVGLMMIDCGFMNVGMSCCWWNVCLMMMLFWCVVLMVVLMLFLLLILVFE